MMVFLISFFLLDAFLLESSNISANSSNEILEVNNTLYKSFEHGWISEKGDFLNNNKELITIKRDGIIKLAGKNENAKHIIAKVYILWFATVGDSIHDF
jgi:hypothetical protein